MEDKKVLLSVKDLEVKFHVRGRILTAIRGISLDIYENESIAIVGESGSGKSVFTKTFAGMLDSNGFISNGSIILNDEALQDTVVDFGEKSRKTVQNTYNKLNEYSKLEFGAKTYNEIKALEAEKEAKSNISDELKAEFETKMNDVTHDITELQNYRQTIASSNKEEIKSTNEKIKTLEAELYEELNALGIGPAGLGGKTTVLALNIKTYPTHIAGMPLAVNICCHVNRHAARVI